MLRLPFFLSFLLFVACGSPGSETAFETTDTTVTEGPFYDPEAAGGDPGDAFDRGPAWEQDARLIILSDTDVAEAQVLRAGETVRITAVMTERLEEPVLAQKAEQFAAAAQRELEPEATAPDGALLPETRHPYHVTLRDTEGATIYFGVKSRTATSLEARPLSEAPNGRDARQDAAATGLNRAPAGAGS